MPKIAILRILLFYSIALLISNPFRFDLFPLDRVFSGLPPWGTQLIKALLEGSGVLIGALIGIALLKRERVPSITLRGRLRSRNALMVLIALGAVTLAGVSNPYGLNPHLYGFLAVIVSLVYCIMEEYGWRGYLQEELSPLRPTLKYVIIGVLWYLWHLSFLKGGSLGENLFFLGMLIFGSWGIGQIADATKSILASACFHLIVQIMVANALIKDGLSGTEKWVVLGVCTLLWVLIIKSWEREVQRGRAKTLP